MKFEETILKENIKRALKEIEFEELTKIQESVIEKIINGKNIVAMSSTGSGKTAAFMLPIINNIDVENRTTQALVITPTRELAIQIVQEARKFCKYMQEINLMAIYGGQEIKNQAISLRKGVKIVVGTPGRVLDLVKKKILKLDNISAMVLDEADEMLSMGFYKEVTDILERIPKKSQKLLFSATIDDRVRDIANKNIKKAEYIEQKDNDTMLVDNIKQIAIDVKEKMKPECALRIIKKENSKSTIVFCNTKKKTDEVYSYIAKNNIKVEKLNSDIKQEEREKILKKLKQGKIEVVVVTDVLARGIDIEDLGLVINLDIPYENEYYVHRIGRTARKGKNGIAYTLFTGKQIERIREIEEYTKTKMETQNVPLNQENIDVDLPVSKRGLYVIKINVGKKDSIKAKDIVGAISTLTGINSTELGIIEVLDEYSTIEAKKECVKDIIDALDSGKIKGKNVKVIN